MVFNLKLFDEYWNNEKKKYDEAVSSGNKEAAQKALNNMKAQDEKLNGKQTAINAYSAMESTLGGMKSSNTSSSGGSSSGSTRTTTSRSSTGNFNSYDPVERNQNMTYVPVTQNTNLLTNNVSTNANMLTDAYGNTDISTLIRNGFANNMDWRDLQDLLNQRADKATQEEYSNYFNDDFQNYAQERVNNMKNEEMIANLEKRNREYLDAIDEIRNNKFAYDYTDDPLYEIYKNIYTRQGNEARENTLADASALTGGLPSSYAITAAQQAQNQYMQKIADIIPALEQAAYEKYANGQSMQLDYLDRMANDINNAYSMYRDNISDQYTYNRAKRADYENDRNYDYQIAQDEQDYAKWLAQFEESKRQALVDEAIARGQLSVSQGNLALSQAKFQYEKENGGSGSEYDKNYQIGLSDVNSGNLTTADLDANYEAYVDAMGIENYNKLYEKAQSKEKSKNNYI